MRPAALLLAGALLGACGAAATATVPDPESTAAEAIETTILVLDGGMLRPVENGGRVAIRDGWATVTLSPPPLQRTDFALDVAVLDASGRAVDAAVEVTYEMVQMDHGVFTERATIHAGRYRVPVHIPMPGTRRFTVRIDRGGVVTSLIVVVPEIG